jgi:WD repeat-containing protein 61
MFLGHAMPIRSLCFSPNSELLLTASDDGHMKIYDVLVIKTYYKYVYKVLYFIFVLCRAHANVAGTLSGHASWVLSVAFSPDNQHFVSGSSDHLVKLWELRSKQCIFTFSEHQDQVFIVNFLNIV